MSAMWTYFFMKRVLQYYVEVRSYQSSVTGKSMGLLIEHFVPLFETKISRSCVLLVLLLLYLIIFKTGMQPQSL